MMDIFFSPALIWFLLGIAFFVVELIIPGFIIFFFGIGAWCVAAVLAIASISQNAQMIVFLVSSLITLILLRSWLRSVFLGTASEETDSVNVDSAPATGVVIEAISPPAVGRVKYGGSFWQATADGPIPEGTVVQVVERKDLIIKVRRIEADKEEK